jgi:GH24 family phage-related lysozyme (muramidase)
MARSADNANTSANGKITSGIYEAIVVSHLDKNYMGTLLVDILRSSSSNALPERVGTSIEARYLMPFYGTTHRDATTPNDGYSATQKTYGMWMVPPDVGTRVLVVYVEGISRCYWIGCIPDQYMNFMVPDGRASTELTTDITPDNLRGNKLPVGEYNKKIAGDREILDPTRMRKPYNKDFTQILEVQGLLGDENRGTTTTSARREVPSSVFGVNTPGPLDKRDGAPRSEQGQAEYKANVFSNRLGGSSFVMDDGDDKFLRKTTADAGPPEYVNKEAGETGGDPTVPHNELVRIRTRTGHQILMHNSEDLIYIGNGRGTTWIELTSDGKIDIYANDSISVHSDQDINFTADRDVNIEAGRNINMNANSRYTEQDDSGEDKTSGNINIESKFDTNLRVGRNLKTHVEGTRDDYIKGNFLTRVAEGDLGVSVSSGFHSTYAEKEYYVQANGDYAVESIGGRFDLLASSGSMFLKSEADVHLQASGMIAGDGSPNIFWNSGKSESATTPVPPGDAAIVPLQKTFSVPKVTPGTIGGAVQSIVKRMPTHEPWTHHENLNPLEFRPDKTDIQVEDNIAPATVVFTTDTFTKNRSRAAEATTDRRQPLDPVTQSQAPGAKPVTPTTSTGDVDAPPAVTGPINVPSNLLDFIKSKEGFHSKAFWDYQQYTNGYGTKARSSTEVITEAEAERRLGVVVTRTRNYVVSYGQELGRNWSDEQIGALTSFAFNLGNGALKTLTANGTRSDEVIMEKIKLYNKAGGRTLQGLVTRRNEESAWFAKGLA